VAGAFAEPTVGFLERHGVRAEFRDDAEHAVGIAAPVEAHALADVVACDAQGGHGATMPGLRGNSTRISEGNRGADIWL
jgi:hypothetical protein